MSANSQLEQIVQELKDISDIKKLKSTYCLLVDCGNWNELEDLWTEEAVCDYGFFGRFDGKTEIMDKFFRSIVNEVSTFNAHMIHNDIINIDGDNATGKWYLTAHTLIQPDNQAVWAHAFYDDKFIRVDGQWKIAAINVKFRYFTPFEQGWGKTMLWNPTETTC